MKKLNICLLLVLIVNLSCSQVLQEPIKILSDTTLITIPYWIVPQANKAFTEVRGLRKITGLHQQELHSKDVEIQFYKYGLNSALRANDTLTQVTIPALENKSKEYEKMYLDFKRGYKQQKLKTIGLGVTLPVTAVLSFLLGFYLHK